MVVASIYFTYQILAKPTHPPHLSPSKYPPIPFPLVLSHIPLLALA